MPRVALRDIHKRFGPTRALRGASLELEAGEVHALLGENGAGKTTLLGVLYGLVRPDRGEILLDGRRVEIHGPRRALELGIGMVHQHFMLVPALSVAENLALGESGPAWMSPDALRARASDVLERYGLDLDLDAPAASLAVAQKQRLEIARALARGASVLVLDEPTAVLAPSEVDELLELLARLRDDGVAVALITHKLEEIDALCQRVTVLRHGESVASRRVGSFTPDELGRWMVGDALPPPGAPPTTQPGPVALRLSSVVAPGLAGIDLELRGGEVLALAGIDGNGQAPLEEVLAGVRRPSSGEVAVERPPLVVLPGDRQRTGLVLDLSIAENLVLPQAARDAGAAVFRGNAAVFRYGLLQRDALDRLARAAMARLGIDGSPLDGVRALSGGNQQKVCVGRALSEEPGVLVAINPTRGLDVAATALVRDEIRSLAQQGVGVLLISTDLDEVLELATRVAVLFRGRLLPVEGRADRERIGRRMLGQGEEP